MKDPKSLTRTPVTRRTVIAGATLIPLAALTAAPQPAVAQTATVFSAGQRRTLDAFIERLIPTDENGPGAVECGVGEYIDRCLGDYLAAEKTSILNGLAALNAYASSSQSSAFADLSAEKQDAVLTAIEKNQAPNLQAFFNRVHRLTLEGMFSDPFYGGNRNFAGWDLIRYPGAKLASSPEDQRMKTEAKPVRRSIYGAGENHGH